MSAGADTGAGWAARPESGGEHAARLALGLALRLGRRRAARLLGPAALWFLLTDRAARRASAAYLARALPRPPHWGDLYRHFHCFAAAILDRVFLLAGRDDGLRIETEGLDALHDALRAGRGAVLLGAHLGSFAVLRAVARHAPVRARACMFRGHRGALTALLESLAPGMADEIIEIGAPDAMLRVAEALERGEMVGMLADRAPRGERMLKLPFLGGVAGFPAGPFAAAAMLDAPVLLFAGLRLGSGRYRVRFESFPLPPRGPRAERGARLAESMARYAAWLEASCRAHPYNWFNFYDFWSPLPNDPPPDARPGAVPGPASGDPRDPAGDAGPRR